MVKRILLWRRSFSQLILHWRWRRDVPPKQPLTRCIIPEDRTMRCFHCFCLVVISFLNYVCVCNIFSVGILRGPRPFSKAPAPLSSVPLWLQTSRRRGTPPSWLRWMTTLNPPPPPARRWSATNRGPRTASPHPQTPRGAQVFDCTISHFVAWSTLTINLQLVFFFFCPLKPVFVRSPDCHEAHFLPFLFELLTAMKLISYRFCSVSWLPWGSFLTVFVRSLDCWLPWSSFLTVFVRSPYCREAHFLPFLFGLLIAVKLISYRFCSVSCLPRSHFLSFIYVTDE
jgi:hypothetical protein